MEDKPDVYVRLREHLDVMPVGFPATASGVELRILRRFFTPEEAEVALLLSAVPETLDRVFRRARGGGRTREEVEAILDRLSEKGAILGGRVLAAPDGTKRYSKAMLAIGIYEFQVDRLTAELQRDFEQYIAEGFGAAFLGPRTKQMRPVPVDVALLPERRVGRYDDARRLIGESSGPWAVFNCVCRQGKDLLGEPCRQTSERRTCLGLKDIARYCLDSGVGQSLSREEALALVGRAERDGMVLQPENAQDPLFICFCCGCCCGVLQMAKRFPRPADYVHSNHNAAVDRDLCIDCGTCHSRCPMEAIRSENGAAAVDLGRCIGCGVCTGTCPSGAVRLVKKAREVVPPPSHQALYGKILRERFGLLGTARIVGKAALGRRI